MPTISEIAAYIGAAAWVPQIISWIYRWFINPEVSIVPERQVELGFTTYGPIFNIRLALSVNKKPTIIDTLEAIIDHEEGDSHHLTWTGMQETIGEISSFGGPRQFIQKDQPAIALKLTPDLLIERFVRFQDLTFQESHRILLNSVTAHLNYLKEKESDYRDKILESREVSDMVQLFKQKFWWKKGKYTFRFQISSSNNANLRNVKFAFDMAQSDVDSLRKNLDFVKTDFENAIKSDIQGYQFKPVPWNWSNIFVRKM